MEPTTPTPPDNGEPLLVFDSADLFQGRREVIIEHEGERYRLRITKRDRLILQK